MRVPTFGASGRYGGVGDALEAGRRLRALPLSRPPDATELLLHGYGLFVTEGFPHGVDVLGQAIDAFVSAPVTGEENIRALEAAAALGGHARACARGAVPAAPLPGGAGRRAALGRAVPRRVAG